MSQHDSLRSREKQHKVKNQKSKFDDKENLIATKRVKEYLEERFDLATNFPNLKIDFSKNVTLKFVQKFLKETTGRDIGNKYIDTKTTPDGGMLFLKDIETGEEKPILISESKRQGTNDERLAEGKEKQATGNAIERLGKNLTAYRTLFSGIPVTPFVCFGWGCDFAENQDTVNAKLYSLNQFYPFNKIYVNKINNDQPVSLFFRKERWSEDEKFEIMKEIAETTLRYYLY